MSISSALARVVLLIAGGIALIGAASSANADPPAVDYLFPAGGQRGKAVNVAVSGKLGIWPVHAWADSPLIQISAGKERGTLLFQVDPHAAIGPHLFRLYSDEGASAPRCFVVSDGPEIAETEPNDDAKSAQELKELPVTVNGKLEKPGDVDCYAVDLQAGACLVASLQGRRLGSPIDPMLHIVDANGIEVAFAHDGLGLDPLLAFHADQAGRYVVRVSAFAYPPAADVKLAGGKGDVYRLSLTTGPAAHFLMPTGAQRRNNPSLQILGWNLPNSRPSSIDVTTTDVSATASYLNVPAPGIDGWLRVELGEAPEWLDSQAHDETVTLPVPVNVSGILKARGETARFAFNAAKGQALRLRVRAGAMNSPLDAVIGVEDDRGNALATANGAGGASDPTLDWVAPVDGRYRVTLRDLYGKGGPDYVYRLEVGKPRPSVHATVDSHAYRVVAGGSTQVKVTVTRNDGHTGDLVAVATSLPAGVTSTSATISGSGDVTLTLSAASDAKAAGNVIRLMLLGTDPDKPEAHPLTYALRQEKEAGQELVDFTQDIWLTVSPKPPATGPAPQPSN